MKGISKGEEKEWSSDRELMINQEMKQRNKKSMKKKVKKV